MVGLSLIAFVFTVQSFELALDEGIRRYWNGEYEATIDVLEIACQMNASSGEKIECHKYLAFSHVALGADAHADEEFTELLATDAGYRLDESLVSPKILTRFERARKNLATTIYLEGKQAYQNEQFMDAVTLFERAMALDPTQELAHEYAELSRERIQLNQVQSPQTPATPIPTEVGPEPVPASELENRVYRLTSDITPPVLVKRISPSYPRTARLRRKQGAVIISAVIGKNGSIREAKVIRSASDQLDGAALDAITQWQYQPATLNGSPVAVYVIVELSFTLDGS